MNPYRTPGESTPDPDYIDDECRWVEERIIATAVLVRAQGRKLGRRVLLSPKTFADVAIRLQAKVKEGPHCAYFMIHTPLGGMWVVPSEHIRDGRYQFEHREDL